MKTQVLIMAGWLIGSGVMAQTQKGNGILSGNVSVNYNRLESSNLGPTTWTPGVTLTAGRFWRDNWLAGLSLTGSATFSRQPITQNPDQTYPTTFVSGDVTPFVRKYWTFNAVYLFAGAGLSVNLTNRKQSYFDANGRILENGSKSTAFSISPRLEAGVNYFLTNRLGLQLTVSANALPLNATGLNAGLIYWTGPDRRTDSPEERANAQTDPGRWVLEGGFSTTNQKDSQLQSDTRANYESSSDAYSFSPSVGYFIKKNSLIGMSIPVSYYANKTINSGVSTADNATWSVGLAPYFQHYWSSTRLTPYTRVTAGYTRYNAKSSGGDNINGGVTVGLAYMAGNRFIIETSLANASVSYLAFDRLSSTSSSKLWNATVSAGLTGNFAIRYVL